MGFFGKLLSGKKRNSADGDTAPAMGVKRVEVPATPKMTKQEMVEEIEKNYREVVDLVRRMKDHLDREEERSSQLMEIARRVDGAMPAMGGLGDRITEASDRSADAIIEAMDRSEDRRAELAERMTESLASLTERIEATGQTSDRIAGEISGLGERVLELTQTSAASSASLKAIREGASDRDSRFVTSIESARKSIVRAIWIGAAVVGLALIAAAIIFSMNGAPPTP